MKLSLAYLTGMIDEIPPEAWADLFEAAGWPASLAQKRGTPKHEQIVTALTDDDLSDELLEALDVLETLGTSAGRAAIEAALADQHLLPDVLPPNEGDRVYALRLFIGQRQDTALGDVLARAQIQIQQGVGNRPANEFLGKEAKRIPDAKKKAKALVQATLDFCCERKLGDYVQVKAIEDDDVCVFRVHRSHHTKRPLAVVAGRSAHATIEYRPVHVDILRYDKVRGQLRIMASAASAVEFYRCTLGLILFGDSAFFDGETTCSLRGLQERGPAALTDHKIDDVGRVWMTECLWEHGDRDRLHFRSPDCFRKIESLGLRLSEGELVQAKLKMQATGKSTRPVTITIRTPNRIEVRPKWQEPLAERYLRAIGIYNPKAVEASRDIWSMAPWRQPTEAWRELFGRDRDLLIASGALEKIGLESIPHPEHDGAGNVLKAHELADGAIYGVSQIEEIPSRSLTPTDLDGHELQPEAFRAFLRSRLNIKSGGKAWDGQELLHLGVLELGDQRIHVSYALRPLAPGGGPRLREAAGANRFVVLLPTSRCDGSELPVVVLGSPLPTLERVSREAVKLCGLEQLVPPFFVAPEGTRLIVDKRHGQIWLDGVLVSEFRPETRAFKFIECLVRRRPSAISFQEISEHLSAGRKGEDIVARQARTEAKKFFQDALDAAGKTFEDPLQTQNSSYRCWVRSHVIEAGAPRSE